MAGDASARRPQAGDSLWRDAWRRLRKNRMAMLGLIITVVMSISAILAPWISPYDPRMQQRWTGALPPGARILSLRNEIRITAGARPSKHEVPQECADLLGDGGEHTLTFDVQEEAVARMRVTVSDGKIESIQLFEPGKIPARIDRVGIAESQYFRVADRPARLPATAIAVGDDAGTVGVRGSGSGSAGRFVQQLERVTRLPDARFDVSVTFDGEGVVSRISRGDENEKSLTLVPQNILNVTLDAHQLSQAHVLGTDLEGRDALSRVIYGGRISLLVGVVTTAVSLLIGVLYGAVSGYAGGRVDSIMMRIVDILFGLPYLFIVILMMVAFGRSLLNLFIALGVLQWLTMARIVRGQVLSLREKEFVEAAITSGSSGLTIVWRHLIPNVLGVVIVYTTLTVPAVILQESFLAFIGLTVEMDGQPLESWGALVNGGREALGNNGENWWLLVWPSIAMSMTLFSLNFLGDGLRDALDPQQRGRT